MTDEQKNRLKKLATDAISVQDACNLSGVVHSMSRVIADLREISGSQSTDYFNNHPIMVLYASKISGLTGHDSGQCFSRAYERCQELARNS